MEFSLPASLPAFEQTKVVVIGDIMLDRYVWGEVGRVSPEAPVPVARVQRTSYSLGGAGNVAANLAGLACVAVAVGGRGKDDAGRELTACFEATGIRHRLVYLPFRPTTTKTRIMAQSQQLLRLDEESAEPYPADIDATLLELFAQEQAGAGAVIVSDYGKGIFRGRLAGEIIERCRAAAIPVFIDPKGTSWEHYRGATCVTPNEAEFRAVAGGPVRDEKELEERATVLIRAYDLGALLITRGARGMTLLERGRPPLTIPTQAVEVFDVSGAGDTVIATLAASVAAGLDLPQAARLANVAAGIVVGKLGTQPIHRFELREALTRRDAGAAHKVRSLAEAAEAVNFWREKGRKVVFTNGCFDLLHLGHIKLLSAAAALGDKLVVGLNSDASVARLKGDSRPILPVEERAGVLSALEFVDTVVIFDQDTPLEVIRVLTPDILVKGGDYTRDTVVGADIVEAAGGRVAIVPLMAGKSTTSLIAKLQHHPATGTATDKT